MNRLNLCRNSSAKLLFNIMNYSCDTNNRDSEQIEVSLPLRLKNIVILLITAEDSTYLHRVRLTIKSRGVK